MAINENICMAIRTLSETYDSGNIPWRCVAAGSDGVGVNEYKHPKTKLCKRVGSMWKLGPSRKYMGKCAITRWRIGRPRPQVFSCTPVIY